MCVKTKTSVLADKIFRLGSYSLELYFYSHYYTLVMRGLSVDYNSQPKQQFCVTVAIETLHVLFANSATVQTKMGFPNTPMAVGVIHNSNLEVRTVWGLLFCYRSQVMSNHQQPRQTVSYEVGGEIG